jgi:hypothetical protein
MQTTRLPKTNPTTRKTPATAPGLCRTLYLHAWLIRYEKWKRSTYLDSDNRLTGWAFATIDVVVTNDPSFSVQVLQRVTSGGVVIIIDPFASVVVETRGIDRVNTGFVIIVLVSPEAVAWIVFTRDWWESNCQRRKCSAINLPATTVEPDPLETAIEPDPSEIVVELNPAETAVEPLQMYVEPRIQSYPMQYYPGLSSWKKEGPPIYWSRSDSWDLCAC